MNKPDTVLRELGQLYEFYRELRKFRLKHRPEPNKVAALDRQAATPRPRPSAPGGRVARQ